MMCLLLLVMVICQRGAFYDEVALIYCLKNCPRNESITDRMENYLSLLGLKYSLVEVEITNYVFFARVTFEIFANAIFHSLEQESSLYQSPVIISANIHESKHSFS